MAKRLHAGAQSRKHGCCRCKKHKRDIVTVRRHGGSLRTYCESCLGVLRRKGFRAEIVEAHA